MQEPSLGQMVHYRGKHGLFAPRAAVVTATVDSLDPRGVESGEVPALDSPEHLHLWVFTPGDKGGFAEFNVPRGEAPGGAAASTGTIPPGSWCWPPRRLATQPRRLATQMDFGAALNQLRTGRRLTRMGWNGKDMWVALSPGFSLGPDRVFSPAVREAVEQTGQDGVFRPYLMMRTVDGDFVPWVASQTDLLAEDWRTA